MPSRRRVLALAGTAAATTLAGCTVAGPDDPPPAEPRTVDDPDRHVFGATGEWSTFGANAANNRVVHDGQAPVDGLVERWRVDASHAAREPIVAGDTVYHSAQSGPLRALDADDGSERWRVEDTTSHPLVRDGTLYVGTREGLLVLDAATGAERWRWEPDEEGWTTGLTMVGSRQLFVGVGEYAYAVETESPDTEAGTVRWSRRLFGEIVGAAAYRSHTTMVATEAGTVYALGPDGTGYDRYELPSQPNAPPVSDTDGVYVNCLDGETYGITLEREPRGNVDWSVETGWAHGGMAVRGDLYVAGTGGLTAVDPETGEKRWGHDTGTRRNTAPVVGRDTLFVGGDALYAFDPTPGAGPLAGSGPALRYSKEFAGPVGPGPVVDDGRLYVVAETGDGGRELVAFDPA